MNTFSAIITTTRCLEQVSRSTSEVWCWDIEQSLPQTFLFSAALECQQSRKSMQDIKYSFVLLFFILHAICTFSELRWSVLFSYALSGSYLFIRHARRPLERVYRESQRLASVVCIIRFPHFILPIELLFYLIVIFNINTPYYSHLRSN